MVLFQGLGFQVQLVPVGFESGLGILALGCVLLFELTDFFLPTGAVLRLLEGVLLLGDHRVGGNQERFNLFFVCVVARLLGVLVLLVLGVEVEDDLGELGDLLAHFVMSFLGHG